MDEMNNENNTEPTKEINMEEAPTGGSTSIADRDMSGFPVSIGTGLALETIFDPVQEVVDESRSFKKLGDRSRYTDYLINVETLVRNMLSSIPTETMMKLPPKEALKTLIEEIDFLSFIFSEYGLRVRFYTNSYSYYKDHYPDNIRKATTPKQGYEQEITNYCLKEVIKNVEGIKRFHQYLSYSIATSALVLTHVPADLLSYSKFRVLDLLESHTGAIKSREQFNTKYYPIPRLDMSFLPFFEYLLVVFGDKVMFKPAPIKKRKEVYDSLKKLKVHPLSTEFEMGLKFVLD